MPTDWSLIRAMMAAAIDTCEQLEAMGYAERHRDRAAGLNGAGSVHDYVVSAWTLPENLRYRIIRERHDQRADLPYVPESARIMNAMAAACGELVGASKAQPAQAALLQMIDWYRNHAIPDLKEAITGTE